MKFKNFHKAKPIWAKDISENKNVHLLLRADIGKYGADTLRIATSGVYQLFINGKYTAFGPARAGRGYFRIDEIEIYKELGLENNRIEIKLVSYGVDNYANMNQAPFVTCEINKKETCVCASGEEGFSLYKLTDYVQSISKYSFQRGFVESYILDNRHLPVLAEIGICGEKKIYSAERALSAI